MARLKISYRTFNSGGPGGQHNNRTENAVEASCRLADGTVLKAVSCDKSQHRNRRKAALRLLVKVRQHYEKKTPRHRSPQGERIRTYHAVRNEVVDHASGLKQPFAVVLSDPSAMIEARLDAKLQERLDAT